MDWTFDMTADLLPIGRVATETGTTVSAIRYYEEIGMVAAHARVGGKRRFHPDVVGRISFIRWAQEVGFSLDEIRLILDDDVEGWPDVVDDKIATLTERRRKLDWMISMLGEIRDCGCDTVSLCPRFDDLAVLPKDLIRVAER